jgi:hypothetical protein
MNFYQRLTWAIFNMLALGGSLPQALAATEPVVLQIYAPAASSAAAKPVKGLANGPLVASLQIEFFKKLPQHSFITQTPWYKKPVQFTGPLLRDVLAAVKVQGRVIHAVALDDYQVSFPFSDAAQFDVILAHTMDGETLTAKTKGPLFVVYPYDSKPELQAVRFYERSIWQLKALRLE